MRARIEAEQKLYRSLRDRYEIVEGEPLKTTAAQSVIRLFDVAVGVLRRCWTGRPSDEIRPGYLGIRQTASDTYNLLFKIPALGEDLRLAIYVNPAGRHA